VQSAKVLVTGAAGFIGSHVVGELLAGGHEVVGLDDLSGGFRSNVDERATFVEGSILDVELVDRLFDAHRPTYVFHLAAYAAEGLSHFIRRFNYQNNLVGSANLVNASVNHDVRCFVFTSSIAVYGSAPPPVTEETPLAPEDPYGIAKAAVEQDLRASRALFGYRNCWRRAGILPRQQAARRPPHSPLAGAASYSARSWPGSAQTQRTDQPTVDVVHRAFGRDRPQQPRLFVEGDQRGSLARIDFEAIGDRLFVVVLALQQFAAIADAFVEFFRRGKIDVQQPAVQPPGRGCDCRSPNA
jgi:hypothetical protein